MTETKGRLSRRGFLKGVGMAAAAPYVLTSNALGAPGIAAAGDRIAIGFIGVGGRGGGHLRTLSGRGDLQVMAICDVDRSRLFRARQEAAQRYAAAGRDARGIDLYNDFREPLTRPDVDAVLIGTPDHWHALQTIAAAKAGKDIYCEKPFASSVAEGRAAAAAVQRYGVVLQVGSQERSGRARYACELVRNGRIGKLHTIRTFLPTAGRQTGDHPPEPVPEGFDYDMWLGRAPWAPYTRYRCHGVFRWIRDYTPGELIDRGAHVNDIALWGAGDLLTGPIEIEGSGEFPAGGLWNTAIEYHIEYRCANGLRIITDSRLPDGSQPARGIRFEGSDGWIFVHIHGGALEASDERILNEPIGENEIRLHHSVGHHENWLQAIRSRGATVAPAEAGHRTASFCHLGNISLLLKRKLRWDPQAEQFLNDNEANRLVCAPLREPWRL